MAKLVKNVISFPFIIIFMFIIYLIFGREDINLIAVEQKRAFVCWSQKLHPWLCPASKGWFQIKFCFKSKNLLQFLSSYTWMTCNNLNLIWTNVDSTPGIPKKKTKISSEIHPLPYCTSFLSVKGTWTSMPWGATIVT